MTPLVSDFSDVELPDLPELPGMISASESRYLYWLSSGLSGSGCVVEVGSWLGRSSLHIAAGLQPRGTQLHCFDGFIWAPSDGGKSALPLRPGDDFKAYFLENVSGFAAQITAHKTKIAQIEWEGEPIEFLFLDAPKKQPEFAHCLKVFGPALKAGQSSIAIQDYLYFPAYAIALCMEALGDRVELAQVVLDGSTVGFRVMKSLDLDAEAPLCRDLRQWPRERINATWDRILAPLPAKARERLEPGRALHLYDAGAKAAAVAAMRALPMTPFQQEKIAQLARSHTYLSYPELFTAAGFPGTPKQNLLSRAKRLRDWARALRAAG